MTDEIEKLQTMRTQGALTDDEFAAAKAKLLQGAPAPEAKKSQLLDPKANAKGLVRVLAILAVLGGGGYVAVRYTMGGQAADTVFATVTRTPIVLQDSVESVRASSWQGVPLSLPYPGTLTVEVGVARGNGQDIVLIAGDQLEAYKAGKSFRAYQDFDAKKATTYKRSGRLDQGVYYLILRDNTLGLLSAGSSDVKVHAKLDP